MRHNNATSARHIEHIQCVLLFFCFLLFRILLAAVGMAAFVLAFTCTLSFILTVVHNFISRTFLHKTCACSLSPSPSYNFYYIVMVPAFFFIHRFVFPLYAFLCFNIRNFLYESSIRAQSLIQFSWKCKGMHETQKWCHECGNWRNWIEKEWERERWCQMCGCRWCTVCLHV